MRRSISASGSNACAIVESLGAIRSRMVAEAVKRSARRAQLAVSGVHRLRHSFCSHLAMRGAPAKSIQELAGHQDLLTRQRYMHLSPAAIEGAIRRLDSPGDPSTFVNTLATGEAEATNRCV